MTPPALYHYHTHIITILQSDNQQSTNCEDTECYCLLRSQRHASRRKKYETVAILFIRTRTTRWAQALILLLFYLAFAIPFTFTLRLLLSL